jgi:hypothetical protein
MPEAKTIREVDKDVSPNMALAVWPVQKIKTFHKDEDKGSQEVISDNKFLADPIL